MALDYFLRNGVQTQINLIQSVAKALIKPPTTNIIEQVASLFSVLGSVSRKQVINHSKVVQNLEVSPPIEAIKGVGIKLGVKLRSVGIATLNDLKTMDAKAFKVPGISQNRIQRWQNSL